VILPDLNASEAEAYIEREFAERIDDPDQDMCSLSASMGALWERLFAITRTFVPRSEHVNPVLFS